MIVIRPLSENHSNLVCAFFRQIDTPAYRENFAPHAFTDAEGHRVCAYEGRDMYIGVFSQGPPVRMVGYGMLRGLEEGYSAPSLGLCVVEDYQNQGVGRKLLTYLLTACAERGAVNAMLKVKRDNPTARALYESAGFRFKDYDREFLIGNCAIARTAHRESK